MNWNKDLNKSKKILEKDNDNIYKNKMILEDLNSKIKYINKKLKLNLDILMI